MTTEYHDEAPDDSSSFWNKEPAPVHYSGYSSISKYRRWLFPALTATVILVLIIAVGASNTNILSRLWSVDKSVSNLTEAMSTTHQLSKDAAKDVHRLKFAVDSNREQLTSVAEALKQLSAVDSLTKTVTELKCALERIINNSSVAGGCCPLGWDSFGSSCYLFSKTPLNWHDARDWCNGHESHLVIFNTDEEWDFIKQHTMGAFHWVGLTDERGEWEWVNQTPYIMNRRRWKPGQPDSWTGHGFGHGDEDCAHLHNDGRLNDLHCSTKLRYICQRHIQHS